MNQQETAPLCSDIFQAESETAAGERFAQLWLALMAQAEQTPSSASLPFPAPEAEHP